MMLSRDAHASTAPPVGAILGPLMRIFEGGGAWDGSLRVLCNVFMWLLILGASE